MCVLMKVFVCNFGFGCWGLSVKINGVVCVMGLIMFEKFINVVFLVSVFILRVVFVLSENYVLFGFVKFVRLVLGMCVMS